MISPVIKEIANRAADLIERDGWVQGIWRDDDGCRCLVEALLDASIDKMAWEFEAANAAIRKAAGITYSLAVWNDADCRTKQDVIALLRKVGQ